MSNWFVSEADRLACQLFERDKPGWAISRDNYYLLAREADRRAREKCAKLSVPDKEAVCGTEYLGGYEDGVEALRAAIRATIKEMKPRFKGGRK